MGGSRVLRLLSRLGDRDNPALIRAVVSSPLGGDDLGVLEVHQHDGSTYVARLLAHTPDDVVIRQRPFEQDTMTTNPWALLMAALAVIIPDDPTDP